jgi:predicted PurR-regulated permease PerM
MTVLSPQKQALAWLGIAAAIGLLLWLLAPVLTPFVVAAVVAYAMHPLVQRLVARKWPTWLAAGLCVAVLMVGLVAVVLLIVPVVTQQVPLLREQVPLLLDKLNAWLAPLAARFGLEVKIDTAAVREALKRVVAGHQGEVIDGLLSSLRIGGSALLAILGNLFLMPMVAFYLLLDWDRLIELQRRLIPLRWRDEVFGFLDETDAVLGQYLRGQLLVMLILAFFYAAGLALTGLDLALPIGVFTGLAVFVPYVGFGLGCVLALLAALLEFQSLWGVLAVALVYGIGQLLESLYLTPRLLGERIGLHPIAVIFALLAFGHLFGFVGVLVALPVSAVLVVAARRLQAHYLASPLYRG